MKKKLKFGILGIIVLLILIQFIPVDRTNPPVNPAMALKASPEVMQILEKSCFDCHSNQTVWPAYSYIAPVSWLVAHDVEEGRGKMNFSEWANIPETKQAKLIEEIIEEIEDGEMPMAIYLLMHGDAKLSSAQIETIRKWVMEQDTEIQSDPILSPNQDDND